MAGTPQFVPTQVVDKNEHNIRSTFCTSQRERRSRGHPFAPRQAKALRRHPDWIRGLRDQSQEVGAAFFFKQWGAWEPWPPTTTIGRDGMRINAQGEDVTERPGMGKAQTVVRVGKKAAGRKLDGREWSEFPEVTRG